MMARIREAWMEQRLSMVTLGVSDLPRSRLFYEKGLGWKSANPGNESIAFYQVGPLVFSLFPKAELVRDARLTCVLAGS